MSILHPKINNMEPKEIYYLDLGENPAPLFLRRVVLGIALILTPLGIYSMVDGLIEGRSIWRTITSIINFFGVIIFAWHLHRERFAPIGEAFVRITTDAIEFCNMDQKETTLISLNQIITSDRQRQTIGLKLDSKPWFYIIAPSRAKAKLLFEHLQKALQARTNSNVI